MARLDRRQFVKALGAAGMMGCAEEGQLHVESEDTGSEASRGGPNLVVILTDQLRSQALSWFGETNIETPFMDRLMDEGTTLSHAVTPSPVCTPSRSALVTGLYPYATQTLHNGQALDPSTPSLTSLLSEDGVHCAWIGKWHLDGHHSGIDGFVPRERQHGCQTWMANNFRHKYLHSIYFVNDDPTPRRLPTGLYEPVAQTDWAIRFMEERLAADERFAMVVSYGPPHPTDHVPCDWSLDVPARLLDLVDPEALTFGPNVPEWILGPNQGPEGNRPYDPGARSHMHGYYACILGLERQIGRLVQAIDDLGLSEDTLVVFVSDHGDMGGAQGRYGKGGPYEEELRVPLSFRLPGVVPAATEVPIQCTLADLTPTLLSLMGLAVPEHMHGHDLSEWVLGLRDDDRGPSYIVRNEWDWRALRTEQYKFVVEASGAVWLFDLEEDPFETENLAHRPEHQDRVADFVDQLLELAFANKDPIAERMAEALR